MVSTQFFAAELKVPTGDLRFANSEDTTNVTVNHYLKVMSSKVEYVIFDLDGKFS